MSHLSRSVCAGLAALFLTALPVTASAHSKSKSSHSSKSSSKSSSSSKAKSTPRATPAPAKQKTTVCCTSCDACRKRAAKHGVRVK